jgi:serine phosphatase RsbU (regulator of sigma subunit)
MRWTLIKNILFIVLLQGITILVPAQSQKKIDSLNQLLIKTIPDTQRIECLIEMAREIRFNDKAKSLEYAKKAFELGNISDFPYYKARSNFRLGSCLWNVGKDIEAFDYGQKALLLFEGLGNEKGKMDCFLLLGNCYAKSNPKKSEEFYIKALKIAEKIKDEYVIAATYGNIGALDASNKISEASLNYTRKSAEAFKKLGNLYNYYLMTGNVANDNMRAKKFKEALVDYRIIYGYYKKENLLDEQLKCASLIQKCFSGLNQKDSVAKLVNDVSKNLRNKISIVQQLNIYLIIENYFEYQNKLDSARIIYDNCVDLIRQSENEYDRLSILNSYASFANDRLNDPKRTSDLYKQVVPLALKLEDYNTAWLGYYFLGNNLKKLKQFEKAANALDSAVILRDTLDKINEAQKTAGLLEEHKMVEMEGNFKDVENENVLKEKELEKAAIQRYSLMGGLVIVGLMMFIAYRSYSRKKKDNKVLELQKKEIEEKNLELNHASAIISEKNKNIIDSINYAQKIQQSTLTSRQYLDAMFKEYFVFYKPKDILSGDFYWAFNKPADSLMIWAVGDCTGHGVPGALMSMMGNMFLNEIIIENGITDPAEILNRLREKIILALDSKNSGQRDGMDIALCSWDKKNAQLLFAGANNSAWIVRNNELITLNCDKMPIGVYDQLLPFSNTTLKLQEKDTIYISSDGYSDQFGGENGKKFKSSNFRSFVIELSSKKMEEQEALIKENFEKWKGEHEQTDDVCVLAVRI